MYKIFVKIHYKDVFAKILQRYIAKTACKDILEYLYKDFAKVLQNTLQCGLQDFVKSLQRFFAKSL
jgi:hypothetical protein